MQYRAGSSAVDLDRVPWLLFAEVLIHSSCEPHRLGDGGFEARGGVQVPHRVESSLDRGEHLTVALGQLACRRHLAEIPMCVDQRAMHEVAPGSHQLVVVAPKKLGP